MPKRMRHVGACLGEGVRAASIVLVLAQVGLPVASAQIADAASPSDAAADADADVAADAAGGVGASATEGPPPGPRADEAAAPVGAPDADPDPRGDGDLRPLAHAVAPWWAIAIGALGSLAYLLAAYAGFIGSDDAARTRILERFDGHVAAATLKILAFAGVGGGVAMVFQLTEHYLVPIQAFILGCTWPAVVANYLSARQRGSDASIEAEVARAMRDVQALTEKENVLETLPTQPPVDPERAKAELDELLEQLSSDE